MLFNHHLGDRLAKGEDLFLFCFDFLQYAPFLVSLSSFSLFLLLLLSPFPPPLYLLFLTK
jgi:hypothetical protein